MTTTLDAFQNLPASSKTWVYQCDRDLTEEEAAAIRKAGNDFASKWAYHGAQLEARMDVLYNRFVILVADDSQGIGGCSIDSSVGFIRNLETSLNTGFLDRMTLAYLSEKAVKTVKVAYLDKAVKNDDLTASTTIFDNTVTNLGGLRSNWMIPLSDSWAWGRVEATV